MANAAEKRQAGNVTVATVRNEEEALRVTGKLDSSGIKWLKVDERAPGARARRGRGTGEIKIQVSRSDVRRALELLGEKRESARGRAPENETIRGDTGWKRSVIEAGAVLLFGVLLGSLLFF